MGFLESIVVVYLRTLFYPRGFSFPLVSLSGKILFTEILRELIALVMLLAIAWVAGQNRIQRIANFLFTFGIWDIFYYLALKILLGWPETWLTWDILFLIPFAWAAPVLAPLLCNLIFIIMAWILFIADMQGLTFTDLKLQCLWSIAGGIIIIISFLKEYGKLLLKNWGVPSNELSRVITHHLPIRFPWVLFLIGVLMLLTTLLTITRKIRRRKFPLKEHLSNSPR
jgi:hypothetical protein